MTQKPKRSPAEEILAMRRAMTAELIPLSEPVRRKKRPAAPIRRKSASTSAPPAQESKTGAGSRPSSSSSPRISSSSSPRISSSSSPRISSSSSPRISSSSSPRISSSSSPRISSSSSPRASVPRFSNEDEGDASFFAPSQAGAAADETDSHSRPTANPDRPPRKKKTDVVASILTPDVPLRLSKLMTERGLCSRREADDLIGRGLVKVDGVVVDQLGSKVLPNAVIELHPEAKEALQNLVTIILNKPVGYVSSQPELGYDPAVILIKAESQFAQAGDPQLQKSHFNGLAPAGRLDIDSQGLLVFTQNGQMAKRLIGDNSGVEKEYLVRVEGKLNDEGLNLLNHGLELDGVQLRPAKVEWLNDDQLRFVLKEGRKRQIRRMCELVGLHVVGLKRVRIGSVRLGRLPEGQWRFLEPDEMF